MIRVLCSSLMVNYDDDGLMFVHNLDRPILETVLTYLQTKRSEPSRWYRRFSTRTDATGMAPDWYSDVPIEIYVQQGKSNLSLSKFEL